MVSSTPFDVPATLDDSKGPLVSVILPTYECDDDYVAQAIRSVAEQSYSNVELVFGDASNYPRLRATADTADWIHHVHVERPGVSAGYNEAIGVAEGEILSILNDDDFYVPTRLERQLSAIDRGSDFVYGDVYDVYPDGRTDYRRAMTVEDPEDLWIKFFRHDGLRGTIPSSSVAFRAECVGESPFDEELDGGEDYDLWVRILESYTPGYVPEPLAHMRQRPDSLSSDPDLMYRNRMAAIDKLCSRFPGLGPYRRERERVEYHDFGRRMLAASRTTEARAVFVDELLEHRYPPAAILLLVSLLPAGHGQVLGWLDTLHDRLAWNP